MNYDVEMLEITKDNLAEAQFVAANFINKTLQNRIFFNVIGAESVIWYLNKLGVNVSNLSNIHSIKRIVEKIDIADIILENVHIDVRVSFDNSGVFIPKSHFDLSIVPDIYVVLKYDNNFEKINLIGYFDPNDVQLHIANDKYYFVSSEQFKSPFDMIDYVNSCSKKTDKKLTQEEILRGRELSISVADHDISDNDFNEFIHLMYQSKNLRDSVLEYDNFETLASNVAVALRINKNEVNKNVNAVVDLDDFIDMDSKESDANSDEEHEDLPDNNLNMDDLNGDDLLDDENVAERSNSLETEKDADIVSGIAETGSIAAGGVAAVAGAAAAANLAAETVSDEALELAALAGESLSEAMSDSNESSDKNDDIEVLEDMSENENIFDEDITFDDLSEDVLINNDDFGAETDKEEVLSESDTDDQTVQSDVTEIEDIPLDAVADTEDFEEDMAKHASEDFISDEDVNFEEFREPTADSAISENEIDIGEAKDFEETLELDSDFAADTENSAEKINIENNIDIVDESSDIISELKSENADVSSDLSEEVSSDLLKESSFDEGKDNDSIEDISETLESEETAALDVDDITEAPEDTELQELDINDFLLDADDELVDNFDEADSEKSGVVSDDGSEDSAMGLQEFDAESIGMQESVIVPPETSEINLDSEVHDFSQLSEEPTEMVIENGDSELVNFADLTSLSDSAVKEDETDDAVEVNFDSDENFAEFDDITSDFDNAEVGYSVQDLELEQDVITPVNTVIENSIVISDKNITPGEILIDINKNNEEPDFSAENQHLEELYNNVNLNEDGSGLLNNDVRVVNNQGKSIPVAIGVGGLAVFIILAGIIIFSVSKFMNPDQNNNANEQFADPNIQNNMGGDVPNFDPANGSVAMNDNNDFNRPSRNNYQNNQNAGAVQNNSDLKQIPATAFLSVRKLSWEVPDYVSLDSNFKQYFQSSGKSLKAALSSDLLLATDYTYSDQIRVSITFDRSGTFQQSKILLSSGSSQVDNIVLQSVNQTLKVLKAPNSLGNDQSTTVILKIYL